MLFVEFSWAEINGQWTRNWKEQKPALNLGLWALSFICYWLPMTDQQWRSAFQIKWEWFLLQLDFNLCHVIFDYTGAGRAALRRAWAKREGGPVLYVSPTCPRLWIDPHLHGKFRKAYDFCRSTGLPRQTEDVSAASHPCRDDVVSGASCSISSHPTFLQPYSTHPQTLPLLSFTFYSRNSFKVWSCVSALSLEIKPEGILFEDVVPRVSDGFLRYSGTGRLPDTLYAVSFGSK